MTDKIDTSILSNALITQIQSTMSELASKPNNLLMRCIKMQEGKNWSTSVSQQEARFLQDKFIAEIKTVYDDGDASYFVKKFHAPWDGILANLVKQLNTYKPSGSPKPGIG